MILQLFSKRLYSGWLEDLLILLLVDVLLGLNLFNQRYDLF